MLSKGLKSLRRKLVVTPMRALSVKLIENETHFGAEPHTLASLVMKLYEHPAF